MEQTTDTVKIPFGQLSEKQETAKQGMIALLNGFTLNEAMDTFLESQDFVRQNSTFQHDVQKRVPVASERSFLAPFIDILNKHGLYRMHDPMFDRAFGMAFRGDVNKPLFNWCVVVTLDTYTNYFSIERFHEEIYTRNTITWLNPLTTPNEFEKCILEMTEGALFSLVLNVGATS